MNREKDMYTNKPPMPNPKQSKITNSMNKAFTREKNVNAYEQHDTKQVGESDMNDNIKMEEVIVQDEELLECPEGCGRKFRADALEKHKGACKKIFQTKRKEFDTKKHRTLTKEQVELEKKQQRQEKLNKKANKGAKGKAWKKDSDKFRDFMNKQKEAMALQQNVIAEESCEDNSEMHEDHMKQLRPGAFEINMKDSIVRGSIAQIDYNKAEAEQMSQSKVGNSSDKHIEIDIGSAGDLKVQGVSVKNLDQSHLMQESKIPVTKKNDSWPQENGEKVVTGNETCKKTAQIEAASEIKIDEGKNSEEEKDAWQIEMSNDQIEVEINTKKNLGGAKTKEKPVEVVNDSWGRG
jgi:hypothetical protein